MAPSSPTTNLFHPEKQRKSLQPHPISGRGVERGFLLFRSELGQGWGGPASSSSMLILPRPRACSLTVSGLLTQRHVHVVTNGRTSFFLVVEYFIM